jgi:hypothetical protein
MGISGFWCNCGNSEEPFSMRQLESQETEIDAISFEEFKNLIPEKIFNEINNEKIDIINYKNNAGVKTLKVPNNLIENVDNINIKQIYYHGEFNEEGKKNGIGKMVIINKNDEKFFYHGIWENDILNNGTIFYINGDKYIGELKNYLRDGKGKYFSNLETYDGYWKNDLKDGEGSVVYKDGTTYQGQFKNNKFNGKGEMKWRDGTYYSGDFLNNLFDGEGYLVGKNKNNYKGKFSKGLFNGEGEFRWENRKESYKGNYSNGKKDGKGEFHFKNGDIYNGNWESGHPHGEGVYETKNRKYFGNWRSGMFMQLIDVENKEESEEENFNLNFKTPDEDIYDLEHIALSLNSNISTRSILVHASFEVVK